MPSDNSSIALLQLDAATWQAIRDYEPDWAELITDWSVRNDGSWLLYAESGLTPDQLTDTERELWENTEGIEREYAAKQIGAYRDLEPLDPQVVIR